ncbi:MAG: RNA polymerase sigma-70 factor [Chitinophagaceae bacterium]|nr:RNA polymerase sigma-70 factor [Chitinophagaceae bacterium]
MTKQDPSAFEQVFKTHFKDLHAYAITLVQDDAMAEEMVQQVFFKLWERAGKLTISGSIAAYLYRAVHNESLNYIKHQKVKAVHQLYVAHSMKDNHESSASKKLLTSELEKKIQEALNELPEQCRTVFQMSRFEELKYAEIAERLDISVKTVENHMGKALKMLRARLVDFLTFLILLFHL